MSVTPHFLLASGTLTKHVKELTQICNEAVKLVSPLIPLPDCDIVFRDYPEGTIAGYGVGGRTLNCHEIAVALEIIIHDHVKRTLMHELHHVARMAKTGPWKSLGENIVSEGLAQVFAEEIDHQLPAPWSTALSAKALVQFTEQARIKFYDETYDHFAWFYGSLPHTFPKWTGYSVGYAWAKKYLSTHPNENAGSLVAIPAEIFTRPRFD